MNVKLIVTYDPAHIPSCTERVRNAMSAVGAKPTFLKSKYHGIFLIDIPKLKEVVKNSKP